MKLLYALVALFALPAFAAEAPFYLRGTPQLMQDKADPESEDTPESWQADGLFALDVGRYKTAKASLRKVLKEQPANQVAARGLAETLIAEGEYKEAERTLARATAGSADPRTLALQARNRLVLGDYKGAQELVDALLAANKDNIDAVAILARMQHDQGQYEEAEKTAERGRGIAVASREGWKIEPGKRKPELAELWCAAGECYFILNRLHDANSSWDNALMADDFHLRTRAWMARLYSEQPADSGVGATRHVQQTLEHNPGAADLHYWMAQVHFARWRGGQGLASLEQCLKINPEHHLGLAYRAQRLLYMDDYEGAKRDYDRALKLNPLNMEALGAKALHGKTLGLVDAYNDAERAALSLNPKPARFYEIVADGLSDRFRYVEALPLYEKAIASNPKHWTAYTGRGRAALNNGDDVLGKKSLEVALEKDAIRNNLQTLNLLRLLDSYKNFERYESPDGRWRLLVHKSESRVLRDMYLEHLNAAWAHLEKKYNFKPRIPLTIEAFNRHEDFEVRTVGITGLPALGACFGQLITLDSPSARPPGSYNWASTLRHELDHVWQIQISNGQVPRWLAEGLSVYEEKTTRPEWERHMEDQLFLRYHMDDIPPVKKFNEWFRDGSKILFAYYLGNVMLEFIDKKLGGMGAVRKMLELFGQKKTPEEVFRACLGIEPEVFDKRFREYVRDERIAHLKMVKRVSEKRIEELFFAYEDGKATRAQLVELGLGYAQQGSDVDAGMFLGMAQRQGADKAEGNEGALWCYAKALLASRDESVPAAQRPALRRGYLEGAVGKGLEDFGTFMFMAGVARQAQDTQSMLGWLNAAQQAFPENAAPYAALYQHYLGANEPAKAQEAAESWMRVDENNLGIRMWLIENVYQARRNWEKMADMTLQAIYIAPLEPRVHTLRAEALRKLKKYDEAATHYETLRKLAAGTPEEMKAAEVSALLDLAAMWMQAGQNDKARKYLEEAKKLDPANARIKTIEGELNGEGKEEEF